MNSATVSTLVRNVELPHVALNVMLAVLVPPHHRESDLQIAPYNYIKCNYNLGFSNSVLVHDTKIMLHKFYMQFISIKCDPVSNVRVNVTMKMFV